MFGLIQRYRISIAGKRHRYQAEQEPIPGRVSALLFPAQLEEASQFVSSLREMFVWVAARRRFVLGRSDAAGQNAASAQKFACCSLTEKPKILKRLSGKACA